MAITISVYFIVCSRLSSSSSSIGGADALSKDPLRFKANPGYGCKFQVESLLYLLVFRALLSKLDEPSAETGVCLACPERTDKKAAVSHDTTLTCSFLDGQASKDSVYRPPRLSAASFGFLITH